MGIPIGKLDFVHLIKITYLTDFFENGTYDMNRHSIRRFLHLWIFLNPLTFERFLYIIFLVKIANGAVGWMKKILKQQAKLTKVNEEEFKRVKTDFAGAYVEMMKKRKQSLNKYMILTVM